MCGRFSFDFYASSEFTRMVGALTGFKTGEVFPTNDIAVLAQEPRVMQWGYPSYKGSRTIINARSETAHERPMFRKSLTERRCIIPTTGFFEWGTVEGNAKKQKYQFNLPDTTELYLAGLWNDFSGVDKCVILTTAANASMNGIHNRMPVVLTKDLLGDWLDSAANAYAILRETPPALVHAEAV